METEQLAEGAFLQGGKYRIESVLGQGGFGITYLAYQENLGRKVAIKEFFMRGLCSRDGSTSSVTPGTASNREIMGRYMMKFLKEARTIAAMDHPNIIRIYDTFDENNTAYYVMDYIEGESLSQLVKRSGPLSESEAVDYVRAVAEALKYVHRRHVNHLDVKPGNIMLRHSDHRIFLLDFGLSKQYDVEGNQTSSTPVGISHGYAPIEQYTPGGVKEFSPQTDIYALGATLFYLVTGIIPPSASELSDMKLTFPAGLSAMVCDAVRKAMAFQKKNRPQDVDEFIRLLPGGGKREAKEEVSHDVAEETVIGRTEHLKSSKRKNAVWLMGGAILLILLILFFMRQSEPVNERVNAQADTSYIIPTEAPSVSEPLHEPVEQQDRFEYIKESRGDFKVDIEYPISLKGLDDVSELQLALNDIAFSNNNKDIHACVEKYFKDGEEALALGGVPVSGEISIRYKLRLNNLFLFEVYTFADNGGGTGASIVNRTEYVYFNAVTNRPLRISDMITDYSAALSIVNGHISLDEYNSKAERLPDNFELSATGITFIFPKYSIGYGYQGDVSIAVTYNELDGVLSETFKKAIGRI